jgi:hypothetical protein
MEEDKTLHPGGVREDEKPAGTTTKRSRKPILFTGYAIVFVVLVLALGLGLGLGLRHKKSGVGGTQPSNSTSSNPTNGTSGSPDISFARPSWRRNPLEYTLDMGWDINAAPTTRVFNLTVSEIQAAPDGKLTFRIRSKYLLTVKRGTSSFTRDKWTVSWTTHSSKSKRPSPSQRDKSAIQWNFDALAWNLPKWNKLDGWDCRNNTMCDTTRNELPV